MSLYAHFAQWENCFQARINLLYSFHCIFWPLKPAFDSNRGLHCYCLLRSSAQAASSDKFQYNSCINLPPQIKRGLFNHLAILGSQIFLAIGWPPIQGQSGPCFLSKVSWDRSSNSPLPLNSVFFGFGEGPFNVMHWNSTPLKMTPTVITILWNEYLSDCVNQNWTYRICDLWLE